MQIRKTRGPKKSPFGAPEVTPEREEEGGFTAFNCLRNVKRLQSQDSVCESILRAHNFAMN